METVTHTVLHHMIERAGKGLIRQVAQTSKWWTKLASKVQIWAPISPLLPLVHTGSQSSDLFAISESKHEAGCWRSSADETPEKPLERSNKTTGSKQDPQPSISTFLHREFYDHWLDRNIWRANWCQGPGSAAAGVVLYGLAEVWIAPLNLTTPRCGCRASAWESRRAAGSHTAITVPWENDPTEESTVLLDVSLTQEYFDPHLGNALKNN